MKQTLSLRFRRMTEILIHVVCWGIVFGFPFLMMNRNGFNITWAEYLRHGSVVPFSFLIVFYINYCYLLPEHLFTGHTRRFFLLNTLLIVATALGVHFWQEYVFHATVHGLQPDKRPRPPHWIFFLRDVFSMILTVGLSTAIRMSGHWARTEAARQEAERSRTEAELKNLRNQLNPHFLLNTLNNIYALIAFDSEKAQNAVQELSRLLRHVLYDNQQHFVPLCKEMEFIRSYIGLMRIRLASHVTVETSFDMRPDSQTPIAPLIFISLIENAFKHGISPTEPSYIHIRFSESSDEVRCNICNSHHPKSHTDKSGSGIGLEQVSKRLELTYPGHYQWEHGVSPDGKEYTSTLIIKIPYAP